MDDKILFVVDYKNWAFDNICKKIISLSDKPSSSFITLYLNDSKKLSTSYRELISNNVNITHIIKFWYMIVGDNDPFLYFPNAKKALCIYDYIYYNPDVILSDTNIKNSKEISIKKRELNNINTIINNTLKHIDVLFCSCNIVKNIVSKQFVGASKKIVIAQDGVDCELFYAKEKQHIQDTQAIENNNSKLIVGWCGNTDNIYKKFDKLKSHLKTLPFVEFKPQTKSKFINHNDMINYYHSIDVIVCCSDAEGTPNPILEASACGVPWISTDIGIVRETNINNAGYIIKKMGKGGEQDLTRILTKLHNKRNKLEELGKNARLNAEKNTWDKTLDGFYNFLNINLKIKQDDKKINNVSKVEIEESINDEVVVNKELSDVQDKSESIIDTQDNVRTNEYKIIDDSMKVIINNPNYDRIIIEDVKDKLDIIVEQVKKELMEVKNEVQLVKKELMNHKSIQNDVQLVKKELMDQKSIQDDVQLVKKELMEQKSIHKYTMKKSIKKEVMQVKKELMEQKSIEKDTLKKSIKKEVMQVRKELLDQKKDDLEKQQQLLLQVRDKVNSYGQYNNISPINILPILSTQTNEPISTNSIYSNNTLEQKQFNMSTNIVKECIQKTPALPTTTPALPTTTPALPTTTTTPNIENDTYSTSKYIRSVSESFNDQIIKPNLAQAIIISTQYPRYGGAATCAYELHRYFLKNNIDSCCIFLDNSIKKNPIISNPDKLKNVYYNNLPLKKVLNENIKPHEVDMIKYINWVTTHTDKEKKIIYQPVVYAFNYVAPDVARYIYPNCINLYMITGCGYINNNNPIDVKTLLSTDPKLIEKDKKELRAIEKSDLIISNSTLMNNILKHIYDLDNIIINDLHNIFELSTSIEKNISSKNISSQNIKDIDVIFISSNHTRLVKNTDLVQKIYDDPNMKNYTKCVVGMNSESYFTTVRDSKDRKNKKGTNNLLIHGFSSQEEVMNLIKRSKIILIPSLIESYSITAVEAIQHDTLVLASVNTGCAEHINKYFTLDSYDKDKWVEKINDVLINYVNCKNMFYSNWKASSPIEDIFPNKIHEIIKNRNNKVNIMFCSIDVPFYGGSGTNMYRMVRKFTTNPELKKRFNVYGLYISSLKKDHNPYKIPNIYKCDFNDTVENNVRAIKEKYMPDNLVIFCKNYKIFPIIKKVFVDTSKNKSKIIFSPSGLRYVSGILNNVYANDYDFESMRPLLTNVIYEPSNSVYKFIQENDNYLDYYAMIYADLIIPNSKLTYDIIEKSYGKLLQLKDAVNITNIINGEIRNLVDDKTLQTDNQTSRDIDILFCSQSWKRGFKNYSLVKTIVEQVNPKYTIAIVGSGQTKYNRDILQFENMNNNELLKLYSRSRLLVYTSTYDSGPNVVVEAINMGCNVITTTNIGNSEYIDKNHIITNYKYLSSWLNKIDEVLNTPYKVPHYSAPLSDDIGKILANNMLNVRNIKRSVGLYKIPPIMDGTTRTNLSFSYEESRSIEDIEFVKKIYMYDIYFSIFLEISKKEGCNCMDYIIFDSTINNNKYVNVGLIYTYLSTNIRIWKIKDINSLMYFTNRDVYFLRGTYYNTFNDLISSCSPNKSYLYKATADRQLKDREEREKSDMLKRIKHKNIDVVLCHKNSLKLTNSKFIQFDKFASDHFINNSRQDDSVRIFDFCFVATEENLTKNHHLMIAFINWLETNKKMINTESSSRKVSIIWIGNISNMEEEYKIKLINPLKNVNLVNKEKLNSHELIYNIFNKSKINLLLSGRDAFPRVISESGACGCFNLALDTMENGLEYYEDPIGHILSFPNIKKVINNKKSSLTYEINNKIFEAIYSYASKTFDHTEITRINRMRFSMNNLLEVL